MGTRWTGQLLAGCGGRTACTPAVGLPRLAGRSGRLACFRFFLRSGRRRRIAIGIPAAALQLEGRHGHQFLHVPVTLGAHRHRGIRDLLLHLENLTTAFTFVLINRHDTAPYNYPCCSSRKQLHSFVYFPEATIIPENSSVNMTFSSGLRAPSLSPPCLFKPERQHIATNVFQTVLWFTCCVRKIDTSPFPPYGLPDRVTVTMENRSS